MYTRASLLGQDLGDYRGKLECLGVARSADRYRWGCDLTRRPPRQIHEMMRERGTEPFQLATGVMDYRAIGAAAAGCSSRGEADGREAA